jgi:glycosyltransferase involved in cell wall biosynthesis
MIPEKLKTKTAMPYVSIITINRNNALGLEKTIQSVLGQTFNDYEYIIIDGASDDGSRKVIEKYASKIGFWTSEPDTGIYNAMNNGIRKAIGKYCLFLNSGDHLYSPEALAELFNVKLEADIVYTDQHRFGSDGERVIFFPARLTFYWLFTEYLPHNCMLIKRSLFEQLGLYNETYRIVADWEFYLKALAKHNCSYQYCNMVLASMADGGVSNAPEHSLDVAVERDVVIQKEFPLFYEDYVSLYNFRYYSIKKKILRVLKKVLKIGR